MFSKTKGFTLVEVLVASTIGTLVAVVAVGTFNAISASAETVDKNIDTAAELRFALQIIASDLVNIHRDVDFRYNKLTSVIEEVDGNLITFFSFYTVGRTPARPNQPEGDIYEVEYYLQKDGEKSSLMRRLCPNPHKLADVASPGGMLSVIGENIDFFSVQFFDGQEWLVEWPEERQSIAELIDVTLATKPSGSQKPVVQSFIVNFSRSAGLTAAALGTTGQQQSPEAQQ